jgi:hypothetical protein
LPSDRVRGKITQSRRSLYDIKIFILIIVIILYFWVAFGGKIRGARNSIKAIAPSSKEASYRLYLACLLHALYLYFASARFQSWLGTGRRNIGDCMTENNSDFELAQTEIEFLKLRVAFERLEFEKRQAILAQEIEKFSFDRKTLLERREKIKLIYDNILKISMNFIILHVILIAFFLLVSKNASDFFDKSQTIAVLIFLVNGLILSMSAVLPLLVVLDYAPMGVPKRPTLGYRLTKIAFVISKFFLLAAGVSSLIAMAIIGFVLLKLQIKT